MNFDKIRITYFNPVHDERSSIVGHFGCYLVEQDLYLAKWKLIHKKDGGIFVAPPSEKYTDPKTGKEAYANFCWFGSKLGSAFQDTAIDAIRSYCLTKGITHPAISHPTQKEAPSASYGEPPDFPPLDESSNFPPDVVF